MVNTMNKYKLFTALITPSIDGKVDYDLFKELIEEQIINDFDGIIVGGTTGLGTLHNDEMFEIVEFVVNYVKKRIKVIVGISNYKIKNLENIFEKFNNLDIDGYLVLTPQYLTVSQDDLYYYYEKINDLSKHNIILYHVPKRTGQLFLVETMIKCLKLSNVIGIKLASFDLEMIEKIKRNCESKLLFLGSDNQINLIDKGFDGIISVFSNINPSLMKNALYDENYKNQLLPFLNYFNNIINPVGIITLMNMKKKYVDLPFPYTNILNEKNILINEYQKLILSTSKIIIIGTGKMGKIINNNFKKYHPLMIDIRKISKEEENELEKADIIIDFSHPDSIDYYKNINYKNHPIFIIGTTGFKTKEKIYTLSKKFPIVYDSNFSLGITMIKSFIKLLTNNSLLNNYEIKLSEIHHQNKLDSPSGTLLSFKKLLKQKCMIESKRVSDIKGIHTLKFENKNEKIVINHQIKSSDAFLEGINSAINCLIFKQNGLYTMEEVIFNELQSK